jgi:uncharacterized membrane protein YdjX (TVP38/TMEM64 family)
MLSRRRVGIGAALALVVAGGLLLSPERTVGALRAALRSRWFPALLVGLYLLRPLVAWPITVLSALVGYRYGFVLGVPVALVGAVLTSLPAYAAARLVGVGSGAVARLAGGSERYFDATGDLRGVAAARLVPTPAEAVSAAAGVAGVPLRAFVLGTLLGELPWTGAAVAAGAGMARFGVPASLDHRAVVVALLAAAALLAGPAYRRFVG